MMDAIFTAVFGRTPSSDMTPRQQAGHVLERLCEQRRSNAIELGHSYDAPHVITTIRVNDLDYHEPILLPDFLQRLGIGPDVQDAIDALKATKSFAMINELEAENKKLRRLLREASVQ
jgi:hypothetical protein